MASQPDFHDLVSKFVKDNQHVAALQFIPDNIDEVTIKEISGGNGLINYVYRISSSDGKHSVILKYGKDTLKSMPDVKITLERQKLEYNSLLLMDRIQPGSVPTPYCFDQKHRIIAMADMSGWELLADQLVSYVIDIEIAIYLGHFLSRLHKATARSRLSAEEWEKLTFDFRCDELKESFDLYNFRLPFDETISTNKIPSGQLENYRQYVRRTQELGLMAKMSTLFHQEICYIHADLHWKSIFVKGGKAVVFDSEFSFISHPGINVAPILIAYMIYDLIIYNKEPNAKELKERKYRVAAMSFLQTYMGDNQAVTATERNKENLLAEIALFTGSAMVASSVFVGTEDFTPVSDVERIAMMHTGFNLMLIHEALTSESKLISALFNGYG